MYLEKLEIQGFKSFADKTSLEFERGITSIVGPNGSGKSNCAEAVRWVMGEQSMKALRMKKGEDVIFSGSSKRPRSGFAEVNLHLNNEDRAAPVDWTHVVVGRRLYRDGQSEYLINGNVVRLTDVVMMLAQANFGARTYSVIGQGMIDQIILQSPEERKEFFDEAVGVRQYQIKKEQAENKLVGTENNLHQIEALLAEIEPRLRSLRRQVKKLDERKSLEEELHALQHAYYGTLWTHLQKRYVQEKEHGLQREALVTNKKQALQKISDELSSMQQKETKSSEFLRLQTEYQKLLNERAGLREKQLELKYKLATVAEHKGVAVTVAELAGDLEAIDRLSEELAATIAQEKLNLEKVKQVADELRKLSRGVINRVRKPEAKVSPELEKEFQAIGERLELLEKNIASLQEQLKNLARDDEKERAGFFQLQKKFQDQQNEVFLADRELNEIRIELARLETRRDALTGEMSQELGERKDRVMEEAKNRTDQVDTEALANQISKLKYQLSMIGGIDVEVTKEYEETSTRYEFLSSQVEDIKKSIVTLREVVTNLEETIGKHFDEAFAKINNDFGRYFKMLFNGGEAKLLKRRSEAEVAEPTEGAESTKDEARAEEAESAPQYVIEISASPPGKRIKGLHMLSGGEKALTSIALICAILSNNPSPFVVLDEVDAALDESNAIRFAKILEELAHRTQFVVITHNRYTMENARTLYGVTMGDDSVSKMLSIKFEEMVHP